MRWLIAAALALAVTACNDKPPQRTVFDAQLKAKEKARAVEGQLRESAAREAEAVKGSEDGEAGTDAEP